MFCELLDISPVVTNHQWNKKEFGVIMSKYKESQLVVISNEDDASKSLLYLHGENIEYNKKKDIVSNIEFEAIIISVKNNFFHKRMMDFMNKL